MSPPTASSPDPQAIAALPHIFVDRSLGSLQLPTILRNAGLQLTTMADYYGEQVGQRIEDPDWIALTASRDWIGFHKDAAIRRNAPERAAVLSHGARLFCVPRADLTAAQLGDRYLGNLTAIARATQQPGPYIYGVYDDHIKQLPLHP